MHMDRDIFRLEMATEATSLYILICSILDDGAPPTLQRVRSRWSTTEEDLQRALEELVRRGVLPAAPPSEEAHLHPNPQSEWR